MPAMPAAALVRIFSEIPLIPAMSTTEYIIAMSVVPTYGRVSPEAMVETMQLRYADRQGLHGGRDQRRAAGAAEAQDPVETTLARRGG